MSKFGSHKAIGTESYWRGVQAHKSWLRNLERFEELKSTRAENERLNAELMAARSALIETEREHEAELAKCRDNAERYRWLRENWTTMRSVATRSTLSLEKENYSWADFGGEVIDAAIDAARNMP